jgi:hypothetical protein
MGMVRGFCRAQKLERNRNAEILEPAVGLQSWVNLTQSKSAFYISL